MFTGLTEVTLNDVGKSDHYAVNSECTLCCISILSHAGRDWGQEEKGTTEDEMAGWHH